MKLLLVLVGLLALATGEWKTYENYQQVEVVPRTHTQIRALREWMATEIDIDFWLEPGRLNAPVHILVPPRIRPVIYRRLNDLGLAVEVIDENVGKSVEEERQRLANRPPTSRIDLDEFNTYDDIMEWMEELAADCPEGFQCDITVPGLSYEGRDMKILHVYNPDANDLPIYWMDATIHAREWISTATLLKIMDHMIYQYGTDPDATYLLDNREWYFLPVMNPDGYEHTWVDERLWRKNRSPNVDEGCIGTDLNRNYDYLWCAEGASPLPCTNTYCGPSAGSEAETQVVQEEAARIAASGNQQAWITVHSYGYMWLIPFGNTVDHEGEVCQRAEDHDEMARVATIAADAIRATHDTEWVDGNGCELIYETTGSTDDYVKGVHGWTYPVCPELRGNAFIIPPTEIQPSYEEIWNGLVAMVGEV